MEKYIEVIKKCPLFAGMTDSELKGVLESMGARRLSFGRQETIIAEEEPPRFIGIVLSGQAQIVRVDYNGNRSITANLTPPELFAESFACAGVEAMPVSVVTAGGCEILALDHSRLTAGEGETFRKMTYNLMRALAAKNIQFNQRIDITSRRTTREKLMAYLLWQSKKSGSREFTIPFDRQELADYLEVERSGLSAEIGKLRREGVIECRKNRFRLIDY